MLTVNPNKIIVNYVVQGQIKRTCFAADPLDVVVLTGQSSKHRALVKRLAAQLPELLGRPLVSTTTKRSARQLQRRLTPDLVARMIADYEAGATAAALSIQYGVHHHTITAHLKRAGISLHQYGLTKEQIAEATRQYIAGQSLKEIGYQFNVDAMTVRRALIKLGVAMRSPWERKT